MQLTVLIAEDDPEMRHVLRRVAEENGSVRVVGEAADGNEALELFLTLRPNTVFVDVGLSGKDGVALARDIYTLDPQVRLVFITAYDQYRAEAFDVYATDYLVKPFKIDRLRQTLERLGSTLPVKPSNQPSYELSQQALPSEFSRLFRDGSKAVVIDLKDIAFITREGRRTVVYHKKGQLQTNESLKTLSEEFDGYPFMRTHKG